MNRVVLLKNMYKIFFQRTERSMRLINMMDDFEIMYSKIHISNEVCLIDISDDRFYFSRCKSCSKLVEKNTSPRIFCLKKTSHK